MVRFLREKKGKKSRKAFTEGDWKGCVLACHCFQVRLSYCILVDPDSGSICVRVWSALQLQESDRSAPACDLIVCAISDFGLADHLWSFKELLFKRLKPGKFLLLIGTIQHFLAFEKALGGVQVTLADHVLDLPFVFGYTALDS